MAEVDNYIPANPLVTPSISQTSEPDEPNHSAPIPLLVSKERVALGVTTPIVYE